jgi:hypothetical protein
MELPCEIRIVAKGANHHILIERLAHAEQRTTTLKEMCSVIKPMRIDQFAAGHAALGEKPSHMARREGLGEPHPVPTVRTQQASPHLEIQLRRAADIVTLKHCVLRVGALRSDSGTHSFPTAGLIASDHVFLWQEG